MSKFFSQKFNELIPYTPGEQPQDKRYIKLNTNESPYAPSDEVSKAVADSATKLMLYSDPECKELRKEAANVFGIKENQIVMVNGSDEVLNFAFMAFSDKDRPLAFADITYGFYPVFAKLNNIPYEEIKLKEDFSIDVNDYIGINKTIVIANPNAPTGMTISLADIERIVKSNPNNVVIVDEAYVDFGGESAIKLIDKYDNLFVTGTFSKSRSMAGARLGFGIANSKLIDDINTIRYSTNPYNVNSLTIAAGVQALKTNNYYMEKCKTIIETRAWTTEELKKLGFIVLDSCANFVFAKSNKISGKDLYLKLKERGILIRHFEKERIKDFNRITIGKKEDMVTFIKTVKEILESEK